MNATFSERAYPGRVIILGRTPSGTHDVAAYALTGRSPSSQARKLISEADGSIRTQVTDPALLAQGNPDLLLYRCVCIHQDQLLISNGAQTELLQKTAETLTSSGQRYTPISLLTQAFATPHMVPASTPGKELDLTQYEPDPPNFTPRISGVLGREVAAFALLKRAPLDAHTTQAGGPCAARFYFQLPLLPGAGAMLSTYQGPNVPSGQAIPPYQGEPTPLSIPDGDAKTIATRLYEALGPKKDHAPDLRIAVAAILRNRSDQSYRYHILNRQEKAQ